MSPMKAKLVSWISPPRKPPDRGSSSSLGADPALQELRPPPQPPESTFHNIPDYCGGTPMKLLMSVAR
ncbi:unnamed protein product [Arabis nemorensis]|uniref:Uncharacterized protein n=1 Tax=Arabis nemorensis TaxID=586526 RepID=A0A565AUK4_9BRAS|nr:unnamed protein product [Arabis nemorensis]